MTIIKGIKIETKEEKRKRIYNEWIRAHNSKPQEIKHEKFELKKTEKNNSITDYTAVREDLLTFPEKKVFIVLIKICSKLYLRVHPKIRLADILKARDKELQKRTFGLHIDFTICNVRSKPILLVELDDKSHINNSITIENDIIKDKICEENGLPLLRIEKTHNNEYCIDKLEKQILKAIKSFN